MNRVAGSSVDGCRSGVYSEPREIENCRGAGTDSQPNESRELIDFIAHFLRTGADCGAVDEKSKR